MSPPALAVTSARVIGSFSCDHHSALLPGKVFWRSHWSIQVTWPEYWPLIGWMWRPCQSWWPDAKKEDVTLAWGVRSVTRPLGDTNTYWRSLANHLIFLRMGPRWIRTWAIHLFETFIFRSLPNCAIIHMLVSLLKWPGLTRYRLWTQTPRQHLEEGDHDQTLSDKMRDDSRSGQIGILCFFIPEQQGWAMADTSNKNDGGKVLLGKT